MKAISICLLITLLALQYKLWKGDRGIFEWKELEKKYIAQHQENQNLKKRNHVLSVEINELKSGESALEEQARTELGMIRNGEVYYQFVD